jgi:hypothetical protein
VVRCAVRMALMVTSSSGCQDLRRPELPSSAAVCLELCTAVEDQRPLGGFASSSGGSCCGGAPGEGRGGAKGEREEGEGDHLSARGTMVLPAQPSKGQNHGGVVALVRFLGVEISHRPRFKKATHL